MYEGPERRMNREEEEHIAVLAAKAATKEVFSALGVDVNDPKQMEEFREDLRFGGRLRRAADKGFLAAVTMMVGVVMTLLWYGIQAAFKGHS